MEDYIRTSRGTVLLSEAARRNQRLLGLFKIGTDKHLRRTDFSSKYAKPRRGEASDRRNVTARPKSLYDFRVRYDIESIKTSKTTEFHDQIFDNEPDRRELGRGEEPRAVFTERREYCAETKDENIGLKRKKSKGRTDLRTQDENLFIEVPIDYSRSKATNRAELNETEHQSDKKNQESGSLRKSQLELSNTDKLENTKSKNSMKARLQYYLESREEYRRSAVPDFSHSPDLCNRTQHDERKQPEQEPERQMGNNDRIATEKTKNKGSETDKNSELDASDVFQKDKQKSFDNYLSGSGFENDLEDRPPKGHNIDGSCSQIWHRGRQKSNCKKQGIEDTKFENVRAGSSSIEAASSDYVKVERRRKSEKLLGDDNVQLIDNLLAELRHWNEHPSSASTETPTCSDLKCNENQELNRSGICINGNDINLDEVQTSMNSDKDCDPLPGVNNIHTRNRRERSREKSTWPEKSMLQNDRDLYNTVSFQSNNFKSTAVSESQVLACPRPDKTGTVVTEDDRLHMIACPAQYGTAITTIQTSGGAENVTLSTKDNIEASINADWDEFRVLQCSEIDKARIVIGQKTDNEIETKYKETVKTAAAKSQITNEDKIVTRTMRNDNNAGDYRSQEIASTAQPDFNASFVQTSYKEQLITSSRVDDFSREIRSSTRNDAAATVRTTDKETCYNDIDCLDCVRSDMYQAVPAPLQMSDKAYEEQSYVNNNKETAFSTDSCVLDCANGINSAEYFSYQSNDKQERVSLQRDSRTEANANYKNLQRLETDSIKGFEIEANANISDSLTCPIGLRTDILPMHDSFIMDDAARSDTGRDAMCLEEDITAIALSNSNKPGDSRQGVQQQESRDFDLFKREPLRDFNSTQQDTAADKTCAKSNDWHGTKRVNVEIGRDDKQEASLENVSGKREMLNDTMRCTDTNAIPHYTLNDKLVHEAQNSPDRIDVVGNVASDTIDEGMSSNILSLKREVSLEKERSDYTPDAREDSSSSIAYDLKVMLDEISGVEKETQIPSTDAKIVTEMVSDITIKSASGDQDKTLKEANDLSQSGTSVVVEDIHLLAAPEKSRTTFERETSTKQSSTYDSIHEVEDNLGQPIEISPNNDRIASIHNEGCNGSTSIPIKTRSDELRKDKTEATARMAIEHQEDDILHSFDERFARLYWKIKQYSLDSLKNKGDKRQRPLSLGLSLDSEILAEKYRRQYSPNEWKSKDRELLSSQKLMDSSEALQIESKVGEAWCFESSTKRDIKYSKALDEVDSIKGDVEDKELLQDNYRKRARSSEEKEDLGSLKDFDNFQKETCSKENDDFRVYGAKHEYASKTCSRRLRTSKSNETITSKEVDEVNQESITQRDKDESTDDAERNPLRNIDWLRVQENLAVTGKEQFNDVVTQDNLEKELKCEDSNGYSRKYRGRRLLNLVDYDKKSQVFDCEESNLSENEHQEHNNICSQDRGETDMKLGRRSKIIRESSETQERIKGGKIQDFSKSKVEHNDNKYYGMRRKSREIGNQNVDCVKESNPEKENIQCSQRIEEYEDKYEGRHEIINDDNQFSRVENNGHCLETMVIEEIKNINKKSKSFEIFQADRQRNGTRHENLLATEGLFARNDNTCRTADDTQVRGVQVDTILQVESKDAISKDSIDNSKADLSRRSRRHYDINTESAVKENKIDELSLSFDKDVKRIATGPDVCNEDDDAISRRYRRLGNDKSADNEDNRENLQSCIASKEEKKTEEKKIEEKRVEHYKEPIEGYRRRFRRSRYFEVNSVVDESRGKILNTERATGEGDNANVAGITFDIGGQRRRPRSLEKSSRDDQSAGGAFITNQEASLNEAPKMDDNKRDEGNRERHEPLLYIAGLPVDEHKEEEMEKDDVLRSDSDIIAEQETAVSNESTEEYRRRFRRLKHIEISDEGEDRKDNKQGFNVDREVKAISNTQETSAVGDSVDSHRRRLRRSRSFETGTEDEQKKEDNESINEVNNESIREIDKNMFDSLETTESYRRRLRRSRVFETGTEDEQKKEDNESTSEVNNESIRETDKNMFDSLETTESYRRRLRRSRVFETGTEDEQKREDNESTNEVYNESITETAQNVVDSLGTTENYRRRLTRSRVFETGTEDEQKKEDNESTNEVNNESITETAQNVVDSLETTKNYRRRLTRSRVFETGTENEQKKEDYQSVYGVSNENIRETEQNVVNSTETTECYRRRLRRSRIFEIGTECRQEKVNKESNFETNDENIRENELDTLDSIKSSESYRRQLRRSRFFETNSIDDKLKEERRETYKESNKIGKLHKLEGIENEKLPESYRRRFRRSMNFETDTEDLRQREEKHEAFKDNNASRNICEPECIENEESIKDYRRSFRGLSQLEESAENKPRGEEGQEAALFCNENLIDYELKSNYGVKSIESSRRLFRRSKCFDSNAEEELKIDKEVNTIGEENKIEQCKANGVSGNGKEERIVCRQHSQSRRFDLDAKDGLENIKKGELNSNNEESMKSGDTKSYASNMEGYTSCRSNRKSDYIEKDAENGSRKQGRKENNIVASEDMQGNERVARDDGILSEGNDIRVRRSRCLETGSEDERGREEMDGSIVDKEATMQEQIRADDQVVEINKVELNHEGMERKNVSLKSHRRSRYLEASVENDGEKVEAEDLEVRNYQNVESKTSHVTKEGSFNERRRSRYLKTVDGEDHEDNDKEISTPEKVRDVAESDIRVQATKVANESLFVSNSKSSSFVLTTDHGMKKDNGENFNVALGDSVGKVDHKLLPCKELKVNYEGLYERNDTEDTENSEAKLNGEKDISSAQVEIVYEGDLNQGSESSGNAGSKAITVDNCNVPVIGDLPDFKKGETKPMINFATTASILSCRVTPLMEKTDGRTGDSEDVTYIDQRLASDNQEQFTGYKQSVNHDNRPKSIIEAVAIDSCSPVSAVANAVENSVEEAEKPDWELEQRKLVTSKIVDNDAAGSIIVKPRIERTNIKDGELEHAAARKIDKNIADTNVDSSDGYYINYIGDSLNGSIRRGEYVTFEGNESRDRYRTGESIGMQTNPAGDVDSFKSKMHKIKAKMRQLVDRNIEMEERIDFCEDKQWQYFLKQNKLLQLAVSKLWQKEGFDSSRLIQEEENSVYMTGYDLYRKR